MTGGGRTVRPYGAWASKISPAMVAESGIRFGDIAASGGACLWVEGRPAEGGRNVLIRSSDTGDGAGAGEPLTGAPFNVRTRVHEYGGGAFAADGSGAYFVNFEDQEIYRIAPGGDPARLTSPSPRRYADLTPDRSRNRLLCVVEDHEGPGEPRNCLGAVDLRTGAVSTLVQGHDFFSSPALSSDGRRLAWLSWDHPRMPWDGTELWVAELDERGRPGVPVRVAGSESLSIFQPCWSPAGELLFVQDPTGWWNLFAWDPETRGDPRPVLTGRFELGRPQWVFGLRTHVPVILEDGECRIVCALGEAGRWRLVCVDPTSGKCDVVQTPYQEFGNLVSGGRPAEVYLIGAAPDRVTELVRLNVVTGERETVRKGSRMVLAGSELSRPETFTFPTSEGEEAHGHFYPPCNPDFQAPEGELPPLVVIGHGGPTGSASVGLSPGIQFWTSRGIAVLDVDYRGSTGYGRAYRDRLKGRWGVFDVADCVSGAQALVRAGRVDASRLAIRGGSAGGYTALAALTFHDVFTAGASYCGISELEALASDTHKFESRYLDRLIGPYPEQRERYRARSPIHFVDRLSCPIIFFQGLEDRVVPPNQAEMMVAALRGKGIPVVYMPFEHEQHGFRSAETIRITLEAELAFYGRVFGFEPDGDLPELDYL